MITKHTYFLFGFIPIMSVKKSTNLDSAYEAMKQRFTLEMQAEWKRQRRNG